jgi:hypothetical protein
MFLKCEDESGQRVLINTDAIIKITELGHNHKCRVDIRREETPNYIIVKSTFDEFVSTIDRYSQPGYYGVFNICMQADRKHY